MGIYSLEILPAMDGWSFFPLGQNQIPYRDYYYPVTPLSYFEAQAFSLLPDYQLLAFRLSLMVLAAGFFWANYRIALEFTTRNLAAVCSLFACVLLVYWRLEPMAGWNVQALASLVLGIAFLVRGSALSRKLAVQKLGLQRWRPEYLGLVSGGFFAASILMKQTQIVPISLIILGGLSLSLVGRREQRGIVLRCTLSAVFCMFLCGAVVVLWLVSHSALSAFIENMTALGGKNPNARHAVQSIIGTVSSDTYLPLRVLLVILVVWFGIEKLAFFGWRKGSESTLYAAIFVVVCLLASMTREDGVLPGYGVVCLAFVVALIPTFIAIYVQGKGTNVRHPSGRGVPLATALFGALLALVFVWMTLRAGNVSVSRFVVAISEVCVGLSLGLVVVTALRCGALLVARVLENRPCRNPWRDSLVGSSHVTQIYVALATLGSLVGIFSSGGMLYPQWFIPGIVVVLAFVFKGARATGIYGLHIVRTLVLAVVLMSVFFLSYTTILAPYLWWGWREPPLSLTQGRTVSSLPYARGLLLSQEVEHFYRGVQEDVDRAWAVSRVPATGVFAFPNYPATVATSGRRPYSLLYCSVQWFDVCPPVYGLRDVKTFRKAPPNVVVWAEPGELAFSVHLWVYGNKGVSLRLWNQLRAEAVIRGDWELIATHPVTETSPNTTTVFVYAVLRATRG